MKKLSLLAPPEPTDASRGALLDGALDTFLDVGIRRTSMGDIAKRAGISPATLYRKFASKSGIIEAVGLREARRFLADVDDVIEDAVRRGADAETQITEMAVAVFDGIRRNRLLSRLLETEPELILPLLTVNAGPLMTMGTDYLAQFIRKFQSEGSVPPYDPEPVAELMARLAVSFALTTATAIPLHDLEPARAFVRMHVVPAVGIIRH
jgi:AcrR family transcriptional regulator